MKKIVNLGRKPQELKIVVSEQFISYLANEGIYCPPIIRIDAQDCERAACTPHPKSEELAIVRQLMLVGY